MYLRSIYNVEKHASTIYSVLYIPEYKTHGYGTPSYDVPAKLTSKLDGGLS